MWLILYSGSGRGPQVLDTNKQIDVWRLIIPDRVPSLGPAPSSWSLSGSAVPMDWACRGVRVNDPDPGGGGEAGVAGTVLLANPRAVRSGGKPSSAWLSPFGW